jgi:hypothetical protein
MQSYRIVDDSSDRLHVSILDGFQRERLVAAFGLVLCDRRMDSHLSQIFGIFALTRKFKRDILKLVDEVLEVNWQVAIDRSVSDKCFEGRRTHPASADGALRCSPRPSKLEIFIFQLAECRRGRCVDSGQNVCRRLLS